MGVLDDAIRQHLELKRAHGAAEDEVQQQEHEALGPARREQPAEPAPEPEAATEPEPEPVPLDEAPPEPEPEPERVLESDAPTGNTPTRGFPAVEEEPPGDAEDVLEETPEFLQETPEHDKLWFEQKPPRDFDFDE